MKNEKIINKSVFDPEVPPREGLIFYRSFYEALASMKPMARLHLYDMIMEYAFYNKEPTDLNAAQKIAFKLAAATPFQFQQHPFFQFRRYQNENITQIVMLRVRVKSVVFMDKVRQL